MFEALLDSAASEGYNSSQSSEASTSKGAKSWLGALSLSLTLNLTLTLTLIRIHQLAKQGGLHQGRQVLARRALAIPNPNPNHYPNPNHHPNPNAM